MSTTSTSFSKHRLRLGGRRDEESRHGHDERTSSDQLRSRDFYTEGSRKSQPRNGEWSRDKLKHELSSFIAEFSYLTDTSNKTENTVPVLRDQSNANAPQPNFQVYNARQGQTNPPFENPNLRKKGVEWEDQQKGIVAYNVQDAEYYEEPRTKVIKGGRFRHAPKVRVRNSRSVRSTSRDLSCPRRVKSNKKVRRRFSNFRASKSRSQGSREVRSRSLTPMRRRVRSRFRRRPRTPSCSRSRVKDMPFRYRHRKSREIIIKRSKPKIVLKTIEPCTEPTLVTLFPKTIRPRRRISVPPLPELPCKCAQCTNKYRSLARLCQDPCFDPCAQQCLPICAPCNPICPPKCQVVSRNCNPCSPKWYCNTGGGLCNCSWGNQCYTGDCCQPLQGDCCQPLAGKCFKSVCFKFGSVGQNLNSNITQYFHSILDRRVCC